jgi:hypothetical protein
MPEDKTKQPVSYLARDIAKDHDVKDGRGPIRILVVSNDWKATCRYCENGLFLSSYKVDKSGRTYQVVNCLKVGCPRCCTYYVYRMPDKASAR